MSSHPLASPLQIRDLGLANRIVMSPMTRGYSPEGTPSPQVVDYYRRRAEGGFGLLITEGVGIDHPSAIGEAGLGENQIPLMFGDRPLAGWEAVVGAVHQAGGHIIPQLWHQGVMRIAGTGPFPEAPTVSPSGVWGPLGTTSLDASKMPGTPSVGPAMTEEEVQDLIHAYVRSAANAMAAGFDGIALHGGHGYMLDNFLWEGTNRREDAWGGDRRGRTRMAAEVVGGIRSVIGPDRPIFFRFSQWKLQDYKANLAAMPDQLGEVLGPLADAGVDVFDASVRYFDTPAFEGSQLNLAGWAKKLTGKLTMTVGGVGINRGTFDATDDLRASDNLSKVVARFERGEFDLVAVGRATIGDPAYARKALSGEAPDAFHPRLLDALY